MFMYFIIFLCTVDDVDEEETNMRNGGDRGESDLSPTSKKQQTRNM